VRVRAVDDQGIDPCLDQLGRAFDRITPRSHRRRHSQPSEGVFAGARMLDPLLDVLDGDQSLEHPVLVDRFLDRVGTALNSSPHVSPIAEPPQVCFSRWDDRLIASIELSSVTGIATA
jgi:hypothetical protein